MKMTRRSLVAIVFAALFCAPSSVLGDTFTFNGDNSSSWNDPGNWIEPFGPPVAGDTAIIPSGKTCIVNVANQAAKIIQVSGTLGIEGKILTLGDDDNGTTSTLSGTMYFTKVSITLGTLRVKNTVTLTGSGTITAKADAGREGRIAVTISGITDDVLVVPSGMTLTGTLEIACVLDLDGTAVVDDGDDVMTLGAFAYVWYGSKVRGGGSFEVSAGKLRVESMFFDQTETPNWILSGGEIEVFSIVPGIFLNLIVPIEMSGGTLDLDHDFETTAECKFTGGTIEVADGKCAEFKRPA